MINALYLSGTCSLGDAIVTNAIVHHYARQCKKLYYPVLPQYLQTLKCLYQDFPNIEVFSHEEGQTCESFCAQNKISYVLGTPLDPRIISRGSQDSEVIFVAWQHQIYANANISYLKRYTDFHLPKLVPNAKQIADTLNPNGEQYILIHRSSSTTPQGMPLSIEGWRLACNKPAYKVIEILEGVTNNLLDYIELINNAQEIHCVASSFFNLVDSIAMNLNCELFFHDARLNDLFVVNNVGNNYKWQIVEYPQRF